MGSSMLANVDHVFIFLVRSRSTKFAVCGTKTRRTELYSSSSEDGADRPILERQRSLLSRISSAWLILQPLAAWAGCLQTARCDDDTIIVCTVAVPRPLYCGSTSDT